MDLKFPGYAFASFIFEKTRIGLPKAVTIEWLLYWQGCSKWVEHTIQKTKVYITGNKKESLFAERKKKSLFN